MSLYLTRLIWNRRLCSQSKGLQICSELFLVVFISTCIFAPCVECIFHIPVRLQKTRTNLVNQNNDFGKSGIVQRDLDSLSGSNFKNNMTGLSGDGYYIDVFLGTPPQKLQILIDTGSANFAVASDPNPYVTHYFTRENSTTFIDDGRQIDVAYTEGEWSGTLGTDIVSLSSPPNISARVNIACITESKHFFTESARWQGILGLAYAELSRPSSSFEPFWDSLISQNPDLDDVFGLLLCGSSFVHTSEKPLMEGTLVCINFHIYTIK